MSVQQKAVSEVAGIAADQGVEISIEIHQNSIADNSWSALHLLELIDAPNVGVNPDLGNIYWDLRYSRGIVRSCDRRARVPRQLLALQESLSGAYPRFGNGYLRPSPIA